MWQTVPETSFTKFVMHPDRMYILLNTYIKGVDTIVLIKIGSLLCENV